MAHRPPTSIIVPKDNSVDRHDLYRNYDWENWSAESWMEHCQELVASGKFIDEPIPTANRSCPLAKAIWAGRAKVVSVLLDAGADPNVLIDGTMRPLHIAVNGGNPAIVKLLIDKGADVDAKDAEGRSPLSLAYYSHGDIADLLRAAGAREPGE